MSLFCRTGIVRGWNDESVQVSLLKTLCSVNIWRDGETGERIEVRCGV